VNGQATVTVDVTNSGKMAGDEIVQMYIRDDIGSVTRPVKELKGFARISLRPGETKNVQFTITADKLSFLNEDMQRVVEPGTFTIMVGPSSRTDKLLTAKLEVLK
jgi:beta-glucosidase